MRALITATAAVFAILTLAGCGGKPSHESVANDLMDTLGEFADTISSVKDEASAEKAATKLDKIADKLETLKAQADELGDPSPEVKAELETKMKKRQEELQAKMMGMMGTLATKPELMMKLQPAMERLGKVMQD